MISDAGNIEKEINSLASSIKRNMVHPAERRIEEIQLRLCQAERSITFLNRAFLTASIIFATMGTVLYYLASN
ncbi:MAG: hypothetical protein VR68_05360 [Peptococcaceae bacterium BRH_c4a]|nr:MAG: hypothetical protein VR68_05360 [Peptococcaceae bacterium BRH_c4a]